MALSPLPGSTRRDAPAAGAPVELGPRDVSRHRRQAMGNLLRMGHCAPTVARTLLDLEGGDGDWLVRLSAGLPGGVGNTGAECGGVTAPLLVLGLRQAGATDRGLPVVVDRGYAYCERFAACNRSLACRAIRGDDRLMRGCVRAVSRAPEALAEADAARAPAAIPEDRREAYRLLWSHLAERGFHCAGDVLRRCAPDAPRALDAATGFVGGTLFMGLTCSALAAGVMAIGLRSAEIEGSRLKVLRMIATMLAGGDAMAERLNAFNRTVNRGNALARWFTAEHGSTECRAVTGCSFSSRADVERYIREGQVTRCKGIAAAVAGRVERILEADARPAASDGGRAS